MRARLVGKVTRYHLVLFARAKEAGHGPGVEQDLHGPRLTVVPASRRPFGFLHATLAAACALVSSLARGAEPPANSASSRFYSPASPPAPTSYGYLKAGALLSWTTAPRKVVGWGAEASFLHSWGGPCAAGALAQAASEGGSFRGALGGQGECGGVGVDLALGYRSEDAFFVSTPLVQYGVFLSLGVVSLGLRGAAPLATSSDPQRKTYGFESALTLALKVPIRLYGNAPAPPDLKWIWGGG